MLKLSGLSALVVDDVHATRAIIRGLLRAYGVTDIIDAKCGLQALQILATQRRNLVITDLAMQPIDGLELTKRIRHPGTIADPYIPILMISGHADAKSVKAALQAGVTEYIVKPISPITFYERLVAVVERPRPLIRLNSYFGPDRRRSAALVRVDRRHLT